VKTKIILRKLIVKSDKKAVHNQ